MTVTIGTTELAAGSSRNEPCQVQGLDGSRVIAVVPLTRSAEPGIYDHANVSHIFTLVVRRHHATAAAAADYVLSHPPAAFALSGDVVFETPSGSKWKLSQGMIERCTLSAWSGRSTIHTYVLRGGSFSAVPPPEE